MLRAKLLFKTSPNPCSLPTKLAMLLFTKRRCRLLLTLRVTNTVNTCASIAATCLKPRCTTRPPDTGGPLGRLPEHKRTFLLVSNTGEYFQFLFLFRFVLPDTLKSLCRLKQVSCLKCQYCCQCNSSYKFFLPHPSFLDHRFLGPCKCGVANIQCIFQAGE